MFARRRITWRPGPTGRSWLALTADRSIVGEVVDLSGPARTDTTVSSRWVGYLRWDRLAGQHATIEQAKAAVEAALR